MKKIMSLGAPVLLLVCAGCSRKPEMRQSQAMPVAAMVISVAPSLQRSLQQVEGVVVARQVADVSSQVMAPVSFLQVHEGDMVRKGQVLVRLSSAPLRAAVEQSSAQLLAASRQQGAVASQKDLAAATYARYATLNERHSVTPHEFDQVKAQLDASSAQSQAAAAQVSAAAAALQGAEAANAYTSIRAPFAGIVTRKFVDVGAMASPGAPLLQLEDPANHEVDVQVNESSLSQFRQGHTLQVSINGAAIRVSGTVKEVVPSGDPASHSFTIKIQLPATTDIYSGMTASVLVPGTLQNVLFVPSAAIRRRGQLDSVLALASNSVAQIRYVSLGQQQGDSFEVISGLVAGDRILAQPEDSLIGRQIEGQP